MAAVHYRLRVYQPRSSSADESALLTPRAGADHSDAFAVATVEHTDSGTHYQPYLAELPRGRSSTIDPLTKKTDIGSLVFAIGDKRIGTDNLIRWATAFTGDAFGEDVLKGRRVEVDEQIGDGAWTRYFTGRIVEARLRNRLLIDLTVHAMTEDLTALVFVGAPHASATYAHQSQLWPLGLLHPYGPFPTVPWAKAVVAAPVVTIDAIRSAVPGAPESAGERFQVIVDPSQPDPTRLIAPRAFWEAMIPGARIAHQRLVIRRLDTGAITEWVPARVNWPEVHSSVTPRHFAALQVPGATLPTIPPVGTAIECYIRPLDHPVSESVPLLINDVHPATLIKHLLLGYYGRLDLETGAPTWTVPIDEASFAAIEADDTLPAWRSIQTEPAKLNETVEAICLQSHLAYYPSAEGKIVLVDLRRSSTTAAAVMLTNDDLATAETPTWEPDATQAVTSVTSTYYVERQVTDAELPKPFQDLELDPNVWPPASVDPRDMAPDIPAVRVLDDRDEIVRVEQFGPRTGDVTPADVAVDAKGLRYGLTGKLDANGLPTVIESQHGQPRSAVIQNYLTSFASELRAPYALGPTTITLAVKRSAASAALPGRYIGITIDELPDPASVRRGGTRLAMVMGRTENGPTVGLTLLDAGSTGVAVAPTLGALTLTDLDAITQAVTLNAAGDAVQLYVALTDPSVETRPAPESPLWQPATPDVEPEPPHTLILPSPFVGKTGDAVIDGLPGNTRAWVRGRSVPGAGHGVSLPSSWAFPSGDGFVDLPTIGAATDLTATDSDGSADLAWTPADTNLRQEIFLIEDDEAPAEWTDAMRVVRLGPGSDRWRLGPLAMGTYTIGVRAVDELGGAGPMATVTITIASSQTLAVPTDAHGFAGAHGQGMPTRDGTYGLAVAAVVYPGAVEFYEAVETAAGSGVFGTAVSVAVVPAVQGDWTRYVNSAPNDGRKRQLSARTRRDPSTPSAFTDAVTVLPWSPLELPPFERAVGSTALTNLRFTDPDATHRTYTWARGSLVTAVWIYDRLDAMPVSADPWPDDTDIPDAILGDGEDSYEATKPTAGFQRFLTIVPLYAEGADTKRGAAFRIVLDPAPQALGGKLRAIVTNASADLELQVAAGQADWPVTAKIYADDPDGAALATFTLNAAGTKTKTDNAALGGLTLPTREARHFWAALTNAAGVEVWVHTTADRDALAAGHVTLEDFDATPSILVDYDDDTDAIRVTVPGGKTKTYSALAGIGTVTYTVGDALDDASVEASLGADATSGTYLVEIQGGGTWLPIWRGVLHGESAHPPRVRPRVADGGTAGTEDVYVAVETDTTEQLTLRVRIGEGAGAPIYTLCAGAEDDTTRYVANGTELGPDDYFAPTTGDPAAILDDIVLKRDQITRYYVQAVGKDSGVAGDWVAVPLSLSPKPYVESLALTWDPAAQLLRYRAKAGPHSVSYLIELDDNAAFTSPISITGSASDGDELTGTQSLTGAARGKVWYARATTYSAASQGGLASVGVVDEADVPAVVTYEISASAADTLTIVVHDPGGVIDPDVRVQFYVTQNGVRALEEPTTAPAAGITSGTYTKQKTLDEKHLTVIEPVITLLDASVIQPGPQSFDVDTAATVLNLDVATDGPNGTVVATFDTDTVAGTGTGGGRYRLDGGSWTTFDVPEATRVASFTVPLDAEATQLVEVQGKNSADQWGKIVATHVPLFSAGGVASGPSLVVTPVPGASSYSLVYTATGTLQLSINGGTYGSAAASPIVVSRTTSDKTYSFKCTLNGQTVVDTITIPSLEKDTATPDLTVIPGTSTATQTPFTVSASNPAGGTAPTITVTPKHCTMVIGGVTYSTAQTVSSGTVVTANRPSSTTTEQATLTFDAQIAGAGGEQISRTIPPALNLGPSLELSVTPGSSSYSIGYTATGTVQYKIDTGSYSSPPSNPFTVSRTSSDQVVLVRATLDGQSITSPVTIPALTSGGGSAPTAVVERVWFDTIDFTNDSLHVNWSFTGAIGSGDFQIARIRTEGTTPDHSGSISAQGTTTSSPFTSFVLENIVSGLSGSNVTYSYFIRVRDSSGTVLRSVGPYDITFAYSP